MYLHEERKVFRDVIISTSEHMGLPEEIIEKDYYVTMILKQLSEASDLVVFKGGTSLSKCFHAIDRFSEDIDIIHGNPINMFKLIPVGILILIVILLLWFGISYIVGAIYIKLKKCNFLKEKK